jgi:hypothetical protein
MNPSQPTEKELLKKLLQPLLEDFDYWFSRSRSFLESETIDFLLSEEQEDLLTRIRQSQQEVQTTKMLFEATDGQVGIDTKVLMTWHQLVAECWSVAQKWRSKQQ